jgi:uncharacterized protein
MADQLPIITGTRAVNTTATTPSTSLIGRGLSAIQRKETGIARTELDARYRQARDIYNRITNYGSTDGFSVEGLPIYNERPDLFKCNNSLSQLEPYFANIQQLKEVSLVFQKLADKGYGKAFFPLAKMYNGGQGIKTNFEKAGYYRRLGLDWCLTQQSRNDPEMWMDLGYMNESDFFWRFVAKPDPDAKQALFWHHKAAQVGFGAAQYNLGLMYDTSSDIEQDFEQALFWLRKSAEQGFVLAQYRLGQIHSWGIAIEQDYEQSIFWLRKSAEQGLAEAQFELGKMYRFSRGVEKDNEQSVFWYRKAAVQGYLKAQGCLAWMYSNGLGIEKNDDQATFWYRSAWIYTKSQGVRWDYSKAAFWDQGDDEQENAASYYYTHGFIDWQLTNYDEALLLYSISAELGNAKAQNELGWMYDNGRCVEKNKEQAVFWYRKAAEQGHTLAQENLRNLELTGRLHNAP